jgi:hypothetical protein
MKRLVPTGIILSLLVMSSFGYANDRIPRRVELPGGFEVMIWSGTALNQTVHVVDVRPAGQVECRFRHFMGGGGAWYVSPGTVYNGKQVKAVVCTAPSDTQGGYITFWLK